MIRIAHRRYMVIGVGFVGLAALRAAQGASVWAVVFLVAAAVNVWLAFHDVPQESATAASRDAVRVDGSEIDRSLEGYRSSVLQWQVTAVACLLVGGVLLLLQPLLAVFAGAAALFALHRARCAGRAADTLRRARPAFR